MAMGRSDRAPRGAFLRSRIERGAAREARKSDVGRQRGVTKLQPRFNLHTRRQTMGNGERAGHLEARTARGSKNSGGFQLAHFHSSICLESGTIVVSGHDHDHVGIVYVRAL